MNPPGANLKAAASDDLCTPPALKLKDLAGALSSVGEGVIVRDQAGRITFANDRAAALLGFSTVEELVETPPDRIAGRYEIFDEHGNEMPLDQLPNRLAAQGMEPPPALLRYTSESAPGRELWSEVRACPIRDDDGKVTCTITFFHDVTSAQERKIARRQSQARLAFLNRIGPALLDASLDARAVLEQVADFVIPEIADYCSLQEVLEDGSLHRAAFRHADPAKSALVEQLLAYDNQESETLRLVVRTGKSILIPEIPVDALMERAVDGRHLELLKELAPVSGLLVPIPGRSGVVAVLSLVTAESGRRLTDEDLALALDVAWRAGLTIDNARLYEKQSNTAAILQQSLLPPELPSIPGVELAARYVPAQGEIGGDFYDVFNLGFGHWLLALGDVCGKGPEAASFTSMIRYTLRAAAFEVELPSAMLHIVNSTILGQVPEFQFCTLACAVLEFKEGSPCLTVSLAGHPQPLVIAPEGDVTPIGREGTLLGAVENPSFHDELVLLLPGEVVMLFTDGALDRYDVGTRVLEEHLASLARAKKERTADELACRLEEYVLSRRPARWADDLAILALKVPR